MSELIIGEGVYRSAPKKVAIIPDNAEELSRIIDKLLAVCKERNAVGLSAPQLGYNVQVFVIKDFLEYSVYINPRIVHESDEMAQATEISLSFPGLAVKVNRPYSIRVRYQNIHGETKTANLEGGPARLFQHEMSHMMSVPFWDSANFLNRSKAIKDWKQIKRRLNNPSTSGLPL
jgi:peptide deformylase